uniref:PRLI-interacting factor A n=1 Tax=Oryza punctata TaxID=4537 RepID=A0A0E0M4B4_ORYPU
MNDPMMRPPAQQPPPPPLQYQMWPPPPPPVMELPVVFVGVKPVRPAWKRVARQPGWKQRKAAAGARWGGAAAPRNTTSYLIRAKRAGGVASLVSPCPVTPAVLPTPQLSPAREVVVEMAKEKWGVDGYGSMKGLIRLRSQAADAGGLPGEDSGSGESDVEEHVEVERRLDHDLSRFEMVQLPVAAGDCEDEDDDDDGAEEARAARLEEENLTLRERLFLMERDMDDLRRRLLAVETLCRDRHRDGCVVDAAGVAEETVLSESVAGADLAGVGDDDDTAADAMKA